MALGQIVIVNGTSGSGKSTTCRLFAKRSKDFWLRHGIDDFLRDSFPARFGHHGPDAERGYYTHPVDENNSDGTLRWSFGERGWAAFHTYHEWIATASRQGCNIIVDHLLMTDPPILADVARRFEGLPALLVTLKPDFDILAERIASRTIDKPQPATELHGQEGVRRAVEKLDRLRPWFFESVYSNQVSDLTIDTSRHEPDEVCDLIEARLAGCPGTAFATLRRQLAGG